jgi:hypothetical protein
MSSPSHAGLSSRGSNPLDGHAGGDELAELAHELEGSSRG